MVKNLRDSPERAANIETILQTAKFSLTLCIMLLRRPGHTTHRTLSCLTVSPRPASCLSVSTSRVLPAPPNPSLFHTFGMKKPAFSHRSLSFEGDRDDFGAVHPDGGLWKPLRDEIRGLFVAVPETGGVPDWCKAFPWRRAMRDFPQWWATMIGLWKRISMVSCAQGAKIGGWAQA